MRFMFGNGEGTCKDCKFFKPANGWYSKCLMYGDSASAATDWNNRFPACGLKNWDGEYPDKPIVQYARGNGKTQMYFQTEGQISLWEDD